MSVCAIMLVKDEADIIDYAVRYLLGQVDHLIVCDNGSTDGTRETLSRLVEEFGPPSSDGGLANLAEPRGLTVVDDPDPAYYQARKMTSLADQALALGHQWVVPVDADELWYATDGRTLAAFLGGLAPDVAYVQAEIYNHLPTALDAPARCVICGRADGTRCHLSVCPEPPAEPNPFRRIGWRQREHGALPKVAARLRPGLEIRQGNHSAYAPGSGLTVHDLVVRHFSWRSPVQYVKKLANGYRAYAATDLPDDIGAHWRMFGPPDDPSFEERVAAHFEQWFFVADPYADSSLIYDPAPLG